MEKTGRKTLWLRALLFALACAACLLFLAQFTVTGGGISILRWERASVVTDGVEPEAIVLPDELTPGDTYILSATLRDLPKNPELRFAQGASELSVGLDGAELYACRVAEADMFLSTTILTLPADCGGQTLTVRYTPLSARSAFLPLFRLYGMDQSEADTYGYANHTGIPAGFFAMAFLLLLALMLLNRRPDWRLLPLAAALLLLTVREITVSQGYYFLPTWLCRSLSYPAVAYLPLALFFCHLILNRRRVTGRTLLRVTLFSGGAILTAYLISLLRGGRMAGIVNGAAADLVRGYPGAMVYWLTDWAVFVCLACAVIDTVRESAATESERRALAVRERAAREACAALEENGRRGAELRHELKSRLAVLSALAHGGETERLAEAVDALSEEAAGLTGASYTDHFLINTILQKYAARAARAGVRFEPVVSVPARLGVEDADLSAYLMNLLDNAVEAAGALPKEEKPFLRIKLQMANGFLSIACQNACRESSVPDESSDYPTTKPDPASHGFGLKQMRRVAEKYGSILVIESGDGMFSVKTALKPRDQYITDRETGEDGA